MRIVIDMQGAQTESRFRGIGRYALGLALAIVRNRGEHEIILALSGLLPDTVEPIRGAFDGLLPQTNIRVWQALGPVRDCEPENAWRRESAELIREAFLESLSPDVVHVTSLFEGYVDDAVTSIGIFDTSTPVSLSLYDLIPLMNADTYLTSRPAYQHNYLRKVASARRASVLLAISDSARSEGLLHLNILSDKVVNVSTAVGACFCPLPISEHQAQFLCGKLGIERSFILYAGGADERKNLPRLIDAYARLPLGHRTTHQLVLAGKMTTDTVQGLHAVAQSAGLQERELRFTGYVPDRELISLYNLCKLFVIPSWHEGFGLPALEAMACGAAVIGANASSLPEVIGRADALFDPLDVQAITSKMVQVLENQDFRTSLAEHGLGQARKFSWDRTAALAINAFEKIRASSNLNIASKAEQIVPRLIRALAKVVPPTVDDPDLSDLARAVSNVSPRNDGRQLFVDISELVHRDAGTGVQRVTRSILNELLKRAPSGYLVRPVYAVQNQQGYRYANRFVASFIGAKRKLSDEPIEYCAGDVFLGLDLQHQTLAAQEIYLTALRQNGVRVVFVVYDLLPVLMPSAFPPGMDTIHKAWLRTLTSFDGALCISRAVAQELAEWRETHGAERFRPFLIGCFHLGADVSNSVPTRGLPNNALMLIKELNKRQTFLIVGTVEPRKGQAQILAAFEQLWEQNTDVNLAIVGKQGWMVDSLVARLREHSALGKRLFWFEGVSDEYLEKIYAASTCLIAASEGEGFGLPIIEAAKFGLPIIARDIPVFREIAGEHAYYFTGSAANDLASAIVKWTVLYAASTAPRSEQLPWLTWQQSAQNLISELKLASTPKLAS